MTTFILGGDRTAVRLGFGALRLTDQEFATLSSAGAAGR
jgi:hypothetical protein